MEDRLTTQEFIEIVEEIFEETDYNPEFVHSALMNDENSTDPELFQYLTENEEDPNAIRELLAIRDYFLDFRYAKELNF